MVSECLAIDNRFLGVFGLVNGSMKAGVVIHGFLVFFCLLSSIVEVDHGVQEVNADVGVFQREFSEWIVVEVMVEIYERI